jgi:hypothetical protein
MYWVYWVEQVERVYWVEQVERVENIAVEDMLHGNPNIFEHRLRARTNHIYRLQQNHTRHTGDHLHNIPDTVL